jgi:hypothetical protein
MDHETSGQLAPKPPNMSKAFGKRQVKILFLGGFLLYFVSSCILDVTVTNVLILES